MATNRQARLADARLRHLADDEALPEPGETVTVSLARFGAERKALAARGGVGVRLRSTETADEVAEFLDAVACVTLEFPDFNDGRPYSTARLLRERYGYAGELRAAGDVLPDQLFFMQRCGFDVLELRPDKRPATAHAALREFSVTYQAAADGRPPVYQAD